MMLVMISVEKMRHERQITQKLRGKKLFKNVAYPHDNSCLNLERFPRLISLDSRDGRCMRFSGREAMPLLFGNFEYMIPLDGRPR